MDRVKTIKVASRRSEKIGNSYFTFEMEVEADVSGLKDKDKYVEKLWKYAADEVDKQIQDALE